jgi:hypothetical protein
MRFEEAYQGWTGGHLTQGEAALLLGQCERSFRRHVQRYQADGLEGLLDKRLSQISQRRASTAEVDRVVQTYRSGFAGWNVAHFHSKSMQGRVAAGRRLAARCVAPPDARLPLRSAGSRTTWNGKLAARPNSGRPFVPPERLLAVRHLIAASDGLGSLCRALHSDPYAHVSTMHR